MNQKTQAPTTTATDASPPVGTSDTLVFQSHPAAVPAWILRCTKTVRDWAGQSGYNYRLIGDELFQGIPVEVSLKAQSMLPLADLGRLLWAERLLKDWKCVIWIDADVVVFDATNFEIQTEGPHLVCREILLRRDKVTRRPSVQLACNPTVLMFRRDSTLLSRMIQETRRIAAHRPTLGDADFGRELLKRLGRGRRIPAILSVGHFNAAVLKEIHGEPGAAIELVMKTNGVALAAANLCAHYKMPNAIYLRIVERLIETKGAIVNDRIPATNADLVSGGD